tara:strand:+ start:153 stop:374 length:222 start_codon:yes stop_codon:yes gene_type:complete
MNVKATVYANIIVENLIVKNATDQIFVFIIVKNKIANSVMVQIFVIIIEEKICVMNVVINPNYAHIINKNLNV